MTERAKTERREEETVNRGELADLFRSRARTYGLISRLYRVEVDQELLDELKTARFPAKTDESDIDEGYRLIARFLSNCGEDALVELAIDYSRCFIGHGMNAFSAAYPYESVYTSEKRLMMQEARDEVLAIYRSEGLGKAESWKESEDHIATELEFMQYLCEQAAQKLWSDEDEALRLLEVQRNFLDNHLYSWVGMLTADMRKYAKTDFYVGLSHLTDGFLAADNALLSEMFDGEES